MKAFLFLACVALVSCDDSTGGDDDGGTSQDGGGGGNGPSITLGGAVTQVMPALAVASKNSNESFWTFGVSITSPQASVTSASVSVRLDGSPAKNTYPPTGWVIGTLEVSTSDGKAWSAFTTPMSGTIGTLTIGSVAVLSTSGNLTLYTVHGSLTVSTLVPSQGTNGLTLTSTF